MDTAAQFSLNGRRASPDRLLEVSTGIGGRLEVGFETDLSAYNSGGLFVTRHLASNWDHDFAIGVTGIGARDDGYGTFVVMSGNHGLVTRHVALGYNDVGWQGMLGLEYAASDRLSWNVDWITGPDGGISVGSTIGLGTDGKWSLSPGLIRDNESGDVLMSISLGCDLTPRRH